MNNDDEYVGNGGHLHTGLLDSRLTEKRLRVSLIFIAFLKHATYKRNTIL